MLRAGMNVHNCMHSECYTLKVGSLLFYNTSIPGLNRIAKCVK